MPDGIALSGTSLHDILPSSVRDDPVFVALAERLDGTFAEEDASHRLVLIWARIDDAEEPLLSNLAYQFHLEGYEGWHLAETLEQKRRLVRAAVILHFYKGTRYSLDRIFGLLDMRGAIVEWWQSDEPDFPPYTFDIDIDVIRAIDEKFYSDLLGLIGALKNLRSHLRKARVFMTSAGRTPVVASTGMLGLLITLQPFMPSAITFGARAPSVAAGCQTVQSVLVQPARSDFLLRAEDGGVAVRNIVSDAGSSPFFTLDDKGNVLVRDTILPGTADSARGTGEGDVIIID